jgi:hypothetical protein
VYDDRDRRFNRTAATAPLFSYLAPTEGADERFDSTDYVWLHSVREAADPALVRKPTRPCALPSKTIQEGKSVEVSMRLTGHLETLIQDLRYSIRILLRGRVFAASVLMLALNIGSTAAVFTLVEVLLLRPLPVKSPEQLFTIAAPGRNIDLNPSYHSHGFYDHLRASNPCFVTRSRPRPRYPLA